MNQFIGRINTIYSDPEQRNNSDNWEELFKDKLLENDEIKEILLYRTFNYFIELLDKERHVDSAYKIPGYVVRLFADKFGWLNEELSLTRRFGTEQIDLVFNYIYGEPAKSSHENNSAGLYRPGHYTFLILRLIIVFSVLIYLTTYLLDKNTVDTNTLSVPYYTCKVLFTERAKQKDWTGCEAIANENDDKAQLLFGLAHLYSQKFDKKAGAAIDWLSRAADQANTKAMYMLGALYGEDIEIDDEILKYANIESARYWLERAADAGEFHADTHLASLYILRNTGDEDIRLSRERLILAANSGQPDAYLGMALFELYGLISNIEYGLSKEWLDLYARTSVPEGSNEVAWLLATSSDLNFRDGRQASEYIGLLIENPNHPNLFMYLDTIAAVHAANGNFVEAIDFQELAINALKKNESEVYENNIDSFQQRMAFFRDNKIWTEVLAENYVEQRFEGIKNQIFSRELMDIIVETK